MLSCCSSVKSPVVTIQHHCKNTKVESPLLESFLTSLLRSNHAACCSIADISIISDNARTRPMPPRSISNTRMLEQQSAPGLLAHTTQATTKNSSSIPVRPPAQLSTTNKKQDEVKAILRWKSLSDHETLSLPKRKKSCESIPGLSTERRRPAQRALSLQHHDPKSQEKNGPPSLSSMACAAKRREHSDKSLALPIRKASCESICRGMKTMDEQPRSIPASRNASFSFESAAAISCSQLQRRERRKTRASSLH
jgi:hypothetical protein